MPEKKTKVQLPSGEVADAVDVAITESTERWTDIHLSDGTVIRTKPIILGVVRIEGQYDQEGNPLYQVKANQIMTAESPEHLRKGAAGSTKH